MKEHIADLQAQVAEGKANDPAPVPEPSPEPAPTTAAPVADDSEAPSPDADDTENINPETQENTRQQRTRTVAQYLADLEAQLQRLTMELDDKHRFARGGAQRSMRSRFE